MQEVSHAEAKAENETLRSEISILQQILHSIRQVNHEYGSHLLS